MSTYSIQRVVTKQINTVKPANSWDEHLENLVSIQHLHWKRNTFLFRNRKNNLKQTNTLFLREKRNQNASSFLNAIWISVA